MSKKRKNSSLTETQVVRLEHKSQQEEELQNVHELQKTSRSPQATILKDYHTHLTVSITSTAKRQEA
jgi:hypothetical protein